MINLHDHRSTVERDRGFTLIELLVVIIIIGILAAIAIPVFLNQRKKGVDASMRADLKNTAIAAETIATTDPTGAVPAGGATAYYTPAMLAAAGAKESGLNYLIIKGSPSLGYCIGATNVGSTAGGSTFFWFDSQLGGLQSATTTPVGGVCAMAATVTGPWVLL